MVRMSLSEHEVFIGEINDKDEVDDDHELDAIHQALKASKDLKWNRMTVDKHMAHVSDNQSLEMEAQPEQRKFLPKSGVTVMGKEKVVFVFIAHDFT